MNKRKIYIHKICKSYSVDIWGGFLRRESRREFLVKKLIFIIYMENLLKKKLKNNKIISNLNNDNKNLKLLKVILTKFKSIKFYKSLNSNINHVAETSYKFLVLILASKKIKNINYYKKLNLHFNHDGKVFRESLLRFSNYKEKGALMKPLVRFFFEVILYKSKYKEREYSIYIDKYKKKKEKRV